MKRPSICKSSVSRKTIVFSNLKETSSSSTKSPKLKIKFWRVRGTRVGSYKRNFRRLMKTTGGRMQKLMVLIRKLAGLRVI